MIANFLSRTPLHQHAEPAQRLLGLEQLAPDSEELAQLLASDEAPQVRIAAAQRCNVVAPLAAAWTTEGDPAVKGAIASSLGAALALSDDDAGVRATLEADHCTDAIRADVARRARNPERRRIAIDCMRDEDPLVHLALGAELAEARMAAAQRVHTLEGLRKLADAAKDKDRGVARLARKRIDEMSLRLRQQEEAHAIIGKLELLAAEAGPILSAVVELDHRWQSLDMTGDPACLERFAAVRRAIQERFDREQEAQRARMQFERRLSEWLGALGSAEPAAMPGLQADLAAMRVDAQHRSDGSALAQLEDAERKFAQRDEEHRTLAEGEALVLEAEGGAGASIESAELLARWRALAPAARTPVLTRRFEAALLVIEKRRLDQADAAKQEAITRRHRLHGLLHTAEQALAAGQLQAARSAVDELKPLRHAAGDLPKPTVQRLARLLQALSELERWETYGQRNARLQLCERAHALATQALDPPKVAAEVRKLRDEWKVLDQQHAGVPKALWERFNDACEKAYAPAAKYYADLAARNKEARKRREEFSSNAAAHAAALLAEKREWREIEHWLRDVERTWREGDLGSVNPDAWKKLDARFKEGLAALRNALSVARDEAKQRRRALIDEAAALSAKATERETLAQVKALQARWQEQAKAQPLARRDEQAMWELFRAACDAVFSARQNKRKEEDAHKRDARRALEEICAQLEGLARSTEPSVAGTDDQSIRRTMREMQEQWKRSGSGPALRELEPRFRKAGIAVEAMLSQRARSRGAAVWKTLAAKERLCDELDRLVQSGATGAGSNTMVESWLALPELPVAWEKKMVARRDAALRALSDAATGREHVIRIEKTAQSRRNCLVELELSLGLDSPAEFQAQRLALQVKQLKERFRGPAEEATRTTGERLLDWCALEGISSAIDQQRCERIFSAIEKAGTQA